MDAWCQQWGLYLIDEEGSDKNHMFSTNYSRVKFVFEGNRT